MTQPVEELLENWCFAAKEEDVEHNLRLLGLKASGNRFKKLDRLTKWLLGEYSAAEFENSTADGQADWVLRASRRKLFIEDACEGTLNSSMKDPTQCHPLRRVNEAEFVKLAMDASRRKVLQCQTSETPQQTEESIGVPSPPMASAASARKEESETDYSQRMIQVPLAFSREFLNVLEQIQKTLEELTKRVIRLEESRLIPPTTDTKVDGKKGKSRPKVSSHKVGKENPHSVSNQHIPATCQESERISRNWGRGRPQSHGSGSATQVKSIAPSNPTLSRRIESSPRQSSEVVEPGRSPKGGRKRKARQTANVVNSPESGVKRAVKRASSPPAAIQRAAMEVDLPPPKVPTPPNHSAFGEVLMRCRRMLKEASRIWSTKSGRPLPASPKIRKRKSWYGEAGKCPPERQDKAGGLTETSPQRSATTPTSAPGNPKPHRKLGPLTCSDCGLLGYSRRYCPACSENNPRGSA